MKKLMKIAMAVILTIFIIILVFWGCIVYVTDYKITKVDTSVSPDGTYELVLKAVGEADWTFGSASGRLILYEGKSRISQADFELFDDGGCIRSSIWEVTWHEDYVEIVLSGDEQFDEQIILYFDGKKERKQLAEKTSGLLSVFQRKNLYVVNIIYNWRLKVSDILYNHKMHISIRREI